MKTIHTIIAGFKNILSLNTLNETPQLIAVTQDNSRITTVTKTTYLYNY
jgi:hypothetical protein